MFSKLSAFYPHPLLELYSSLISFFVRSISAHAVSCYKTFAHLFALPGIKFFPPLFTWLTPIHHSAINSQIPLRRNFLSPLTCWFSLWNTLITQHWAFHICGFILFGQQFNSCPPSIYERSLKAITTPALVHCSVSSAEKNKFNY